MKMYNTSRIISLIDRWVDKFGRGQCYCCKECFDKAIEELKKEFAQ